MKLMQMAEAPRAAQATGATWTERKTRPCPVTTTSASGNQEKSAPHHAQDDPRRKHEIKNRKQAREMTQQVKCLPLKHRGQTLDPSTHVTPVPSRQRQGAPGWIPAIKNRRQDGARQLRCGDLKAEGFCFLHCTGVRSGFPQYHLPQ